MLNSLRSLIGHYSNRIDQVRSLMPLFADVEDYLAAHWLVANEHNHWSLLSKISGTVITF